MIPALAQVEPTDTIPPERPFSDQPDSVPVINNADTSFISRSTDSIYTTTIVQDGFLESTVEYTASDSIYSNLATEEAYLFRDAYVKYQDFELKAGYIYIDFKNSEIYAEGIKDSAGNIIQKPIFIEDGKSYRADNMRYNFESKKAKISKVITQEGDGFLHGENVKKMDEQVFYVKNAAYTTCSHEHPHYNIKTPKAKVIGGDKVVTKFAYLEILDVPTPLMVPFGYFPTSETRKSGIIIPTYGNSQYRGYFLRQGGYYWAINDYLDMTMLGDIYTQGGYGLSLQSNYRKRYAYSGNLALNYNRIKFGREEFQPFVPSAYDDRSDFSIRWSHNQDAKARPDFRFNSNVNIASQNYYKVASIDAQDVLSNQLASSISIQKTFPGKPFNFSASVNHSQNNQTKDLNLKLPQISFGMNRQFPFKRKVRVGKKKWYEEIGVTYRADAQNDIRTKLGKPIFTETVFRDSSRNGVRHNVDLGANYKVLRHFVFNPAFNFTERWYFQQSVWGYDPDLQRARVVDTANGFYSVHDFRTSANLSTKVYGTFRYRGYVKAIRHVMTPSVGLSYRPDYSDEFWNYYDEVQTDSLGNTDLFNKYNFGIYGSPGEGEQGNLNFNLLNTLEAKVRDKRDSTGEKKISILERFSLGTSYNMAAEQFKWSQLSLNATSSAFNNMISMNYNGRFDFYGWDEESDMRVNQTALVVNNMLLRPTSQNLAFSFNLSQARFINKNKGGTRTANTSQQNRNQQNKGQQGLGITSGDIDYYSHPDFVDFNLPWNARISYNITQSYRGLEPTISQSISASGNFELTQNWKIGFNTGYDLEAKDFSYTSLDFYRDLHCWELRATWIPFGFQQSYLITIKVKSPMLSDLKLERKRGYGDYDR